MKARNAEGVEIQLDQKAVDDLKAHLRGPLLTPPEAAYDEARVLWNAMIDRRPALVARASVTRLAARRR